MDECKARGPSLLVGPPWAMPTPNIVRKRGVWNLRIVSGASRLPARLDADKVGGLLPVSDVGR